MRGFLVVGFWVWFACSALILLRRGVRRVTHRHAPPAAVPIAGAAPLAEVAPSGATAAPVALAPVTIADALRGIALPCELAPLTSLGGDVDFEHRAAFFTHGYPAEVVGAAVADELERLGMQFAAIADDVGIAQRDDVAVRVRVHTIGAAANAMYPTAPPDSVVVDVELTAGADRAR